MKSPCALTFTLLFAAASAVWGRPSAYVSHRGDYVNAPEGSMAAYRNAVTLGADIVKLDVNPSKDGVIFLSHDTTLARTMGWNVLIENVTSTEIFQHVFNYQDFGAALAGERLATLREALELMKESIPRFWIDFKTFSPAFAEQVFALFDSMGIARTRLMVATDPYGSTQTYLRDNHPEIPCLTHVDIIQYADGIWASFENNSRFASPAAMEQSLCDYADRLRLRGVNLLAVPGVVSPEMVARLKARGLIVSIAVLNSASEAQTFASHGADYVVTGNLGAVRPILDGGEPFPDSFDAVTCAGSYGQHLQGVATDGRHLYWSFTDRLVKTDGRGQVVKSVSVPEHHGDLCCRARDGVLYVAVNLGVFNQEAGADSQVWAYDTIDLTVLQKWNVPELVHGAGGITWMNDSFYVVGGLPTGRTSNRVYRYAPDFAFVSSAELPTGYTALGIQTIDAARGCFRMGVYGTADGRDGRTLVASPALDSFAWCASDTSVGVLSWRGTSWRAELSGSTGRIRTDEALASLVPTTPVVSGVTLAQGGVDRRVTVTYTLANAPAVVTVDFLTNGVSIGEANFAGVWGDVNRRVTTDGTHRINWRPDRDWTGNHASLTARVTAWELANPPDYLVVGLEAPNDVRFYVSTNALPEGGLANANYRRRKMVMRRIPAKGVTWRMGAPANEPGVTSWQGVTTDTRAAETPHLVTLSNDFYMAIYELTQRQFLSVCGWEEINPSYYNSTRVADWDEHPLESIVYSKVRGTSWPAGGHADAGAGTFVSALRARTGVEFDLPTEAQWEYACRAGTSTGINNGRELTYMNSSGALDPVGWHYKKDGAETKCVGRLAPNAWGLYDMHGNVYEYCLDRCNKDAMAMSSDPVTDPMGPTTGDQRIMRGGCIESPAYQCRSAYRRACDNTTGSNVRGFRLVCPIELVQGVGVMQ